MGSQHFGIWKLKRQVALLNWQQQSVQFDAALPGNGALLSWAEHGAVDFLFRIQQVEGDDLSHVDPYARGRDLIVAYPSGASRSVGAELNWRWAEYPDPDLDVSADPDGESGPVDESDDEMPSLGSLELIYSLETQLLDTRPMPQISSLIAGDTLRRYAVADGNLVRWDDDTTSSARSVGTEFVNTGFHACVIERSEQKILLMVMPSDLKEWVIEVTEAPITDDSTSDKTAGGSANVIQVGCRLESDFLEKGVIRRARLFAAFGAGASESQLLAAAKQFLHSDIPLTA
jgi:hypothetical protein